MKNILTILFSLLITVTAHAEVIKDIRIVNEAGKAYDNSSVAAFTSFSVGEQVPDRETILSSIAIDVNRMRESGRYSYVNARMVVEGDGVVLVYTVVSKHRLRRIAIVGGKKSGRKIKQKSELEVGQFADDSTFEIAAAKIREAYRDYWYPEAKVTWTSKVNDELGTVDVAFKIDEGPKMGIKHIEFEGNDIIEDKQLRKVIQQKEKRWWSFITGSGKYKEEVVDADVYAIKTLYMNNGFLDVRVSDPVMDDSKPKKSRLSFRIEEGQRYRIGKVLLEGIEAYPENEVRRALRLRPGSIASVENSERGSEAIKAYYGNRGYVRTMVRPVYDANAETGIVNITYEVTEGRVGYINAVNISGNERTLDKVIRRELVMYPGEKYNRSRIKTSENRLRNLNYFEVVTINPEATGEGDKYDVNVQVSEKPTGQFTAGVGFSSVDSLVGYVELSQGNFNWKTWPPIGAGQKFKIRLQLGTSRNDVEISFIEPWFLNRQLSFGIDLFHHEYNYFSDSYDQQNDGFRLSLGKPLSRWTRGNLAYTLEQFRVFDVDNSASQAIKDEEGRRLKSSLEYTWTFDSRDRFFNPTKGNKTTIAPYVAGGMLGGETDLYGVRVRATHYWPMIWDMIFNLRGQIESVEAFGDSKKKAGTYGEGVPIFDRMFLGGSYNLRGFEYRDVGPTDPVTEDTYGGNSMAFWTAELTYPIWNKIRGAVFYDWGFVNEDSWDFNPSGHGDNFGYHDDWGIGLRLDLPGFPLHLDYAWPITYDDRYLSDKGRFNFLIGHTF
ncbi:outer membrane protein assembly factor BamA [Pontiella agarivorans]|uniref:Outer membrane protein assembly factor BamA n=1 Tax=Pontiella agarivorans TaxID=3038953 RepID=A0ABU5MXX5_9BACT|nr:outer membrane protein assembly factor BamA [Pontiella agarivorans]MDZ8119008.1 outer membrane protein assembly factor BamA [Pontiella agarivorans]